MVLNIILGIIGAFFGAVIMDEEGILPGFVMGCLLGMIVSLRQRVSALEQRLDILKKQQHKEGAAPAPSPKPEPVKPPPEKPPEPAPPSHASESVTTPVKPSRKPNVIPISPRKEREPQSPAEAPRANLNRLTGAIKAFFTGGNTVVRIGVIILFFGVSFLLRFAAEQGMFPVELRLAGVGTGAIALLMAGWRLREKRPGYALILQGGAIGILYLNLFAAAKLYHLLPLMLTFGLMVVLVVLSGILAVLQDSLALAAFGAAGGFLAPVLISSGSGNHVMLFSYYAILNAGILQVAWFRAWRVLNLIGFVFTFAIGTIWGATAYQPAWFPTTEPFLILFFLFYTTIAVLFAHRQPPWLRGYVDGSLVFGLPIIVFALQARLVSNLEYGLAFSALGMSGFYITLAALLWRSQAGGMRMLTEAFLALGVVFGSLAVPLALDGRWTAAAWAMEGAALIWVGIRQTRILSRNFGVLLQLGGGILFLADLSGAGSDIPVFNGIFLGSMAVSVAGLFSAFYLNRHTEKLKSWEKWHHGVMLTWGLIWWFGAGLSEIHDHLSRPDRLPASLLFIALSCGAMVPVSIRLRWKPLSWPLAGLLPLLWAMALILFADRPSAHLFARWNLISWTAALAVHLCLLWQFEKHWPRQLITLWHWAGLLLATFILTWEAAWAAGRLVSTGTVWPFIPWGVLPGLIILTLQKWGKKIPWPTGRFPGQYMGSGPATLGLFIGLWEMAACFRPGYPDPLPWLPLLTPIDLAQIFGFMVLLRLIQLSGRETHLKISAPAQHFLYCAVSAEIFLWLNAVVARTVHFGAGVPFTESSLYHSVLFQAAISILWTLTAFGIMRVAAGKQRRRIWFTGAVLLGAVVLKLFAVDLDGSGTVARIVSFLAVGGLMLAIGYAAPLPPPQEEKRSP
ncbi:DUF2339 domain-containing protein [Desulfonema ishimotonii]|uniref:DUF2339 domain-containing protein n=1 Tax=Desulfonema ishimotonii TaxID=45657 RepID=A0A401FZR7_9BACT|nr:DUF2339 domain-containing protein [Desulfonema ishimotonii]